MKIKIDFVTNSSSSSFLVAFSAPISALKDLNILNIDSERLERVYSDCAHQNPYIINPDSISMLKMLTEQIQHGSFTGQPRYDLYEEKIAEEHGVNKYDLWSKYPDLYQKAKKLQQRANLRAAKKVAERFIKHNAGKFLYQFNYGDENGQLEGRLEHDGTFRNVSFIQISQH
jgi:hypothetical protein